MKKYLIWAITVFLLGCGQKGPLYLPPPGPQPPQQTEIEP